MKISLMVMSAGSAAGKSLPVNTAQFIIGRDPDCNLRPASAMISKRHCAVVVKSDAVFLRDFGSTNGTFVNDEPVKGEIALKNGDLLKVGPLTFKVVIEGQPAPSKPSPSPKPRTADLSDDDAAAALLSIDDENNVSVTTAETAEDSVPTGSTMMEMPVYTPPEETPKAPAEKEPAAAKAEDKKPAAKSKPSTGAAQDAAKAILDKLRAGKRK